MARISVKEIIVFFLAILSKTVLSLVDSIVHLREFITLPPSFPVLTIFLSKDQVNLYVAHAFSNQQLIVSYHSTLYHFLGGHYMKDLRENWSSNLGFVLAATGSAIGLGNLWKFPFITWKNDGGAFVLIYLVCIIAVGLPIMMAELLVGRKTQKSAVGAMRETMGPSWGWVGTWGVMAGFVILSYYAVVAGWSIFYLFQTLQWSVSGFPAQANMGGLFADLAANGTMQTALSGAFMFLTVGVVYFGVASGIEKSARLCLPALFVILLLLLFSSLTMEGSGAVSYTHLTLPTKA